MAKKQIPLNKEYKIFHRKDFLNGPHQHSDASIFSYIHVKNSSYGPRYEADLKIRDCNRIINLEVEIYDDRSYKNSIRKLTTLIDHLYELREALHTGREKYLELDEERKEREKQEKEEEKREGKKVATTSRRFQPLNIEVN